MFCYNCGKQIDNSAAFCIYCGADQREEALPVVVPAAPATPEAPVAPIIPEIPDIPEVPNAPIAPMVEEMPQKPVVPAAPIVPEIPDIPEVPNAPIVPMVEEMPQEPVAPTVPEEPAPFVVNIPEIDDIPDVPVAPEAPVTPEVPAQPVEPDAPVVPAQPVAPTAPVAVPEEMAWQPMAAPVEEPPKKKKTWIVWTVVISLLLLLAAGGVWYYFHWQEENAHRESLETLMTVAVEGDFSQIESLAPAEYWNKAGVDKTQLTGAGQVWITQVLPQQLQNTFKNDHYDSFSISPEPEISKDQAVDDATKRDLTALLQANYGIPANKITDVRYLEIHIAISATAGNMEHMSSCKEVLLMVQMGETWYPVTTSGEFAVNRIVELMKPQLTVVDTGKDLSNLITQQQEAATNATKK